MRVGHHIGELEIQVDADFSGDEVFVFWNGQPKMFTPSQNFDSATPTGVSRYLLYNGREHFDFLLPLVEDVDNEMENVNGGNDEENVNGDEGAEGANDTYEEYDVGEDEGADDSGDGAEEYNHGYDGGRTGYSGLYENIPRPQPRDASSPNGSPIERAYETAKSAARSVVSRFLAAVVAAVVTCALGISTTTLIW